MVRREASRSLVTAVLVWLEADCGQLGIERGSSSSGARRSNSFRGDGRYDGRLLTARIKPSPNAPTSNARTAMTMTR